VITSSTSCFLPATQLTAARADVLVPRAPSSTALLPWVADSITGLDAGSVGGVLLLFGAALSRWPFQGSSEVDSLTRRGRRDVLTSSGAEDRAPAESIPDPEAPFTPCTLCLTSEGSELLPLVAEPSGFTDRWLDVVTSLGRTTSADSSATSLQARMEEVRALAQRRRVVGDCLAVAVERSFMEQQLLLFDTLAWIAPGVTLPNEAATLVRVCQQFPGQSARQVRAFVLGSAPENDPTVSGRFDRLQAARLYMGAVQFGYFISTVFRGPVEAGLTDEQRLSPEEAQAITAAIQSSTRLMKSEAAWAAASRRAGHLFSLERDDAGVGDGSADVWDSSGGYEQLRSFTSGVQVVSATQQEEFFAASSDGEETTRSASSTAAVGDTEHDVKAVAALPTAEFVPFNCAGLQALLAEGCLYGWHLWGAEAGTRAQLAKAGGDKAVEALLTPPVRVAVGEE